MKNAIQCLGFICVIIGISGITGAIEHETGMIQSVILFTAGALILYITNLTERGDKNNEEKINSIHFGGSSPFQMDKHI